MTTTATAPTAAAVPTAFLGIDLAKAKFDAALLAPNGKPAHKCFPNNEDGFEQLAAWLGRSGAAAAADPSELHACLEATAHFGDALARFLHRRGHRVSVVNPAAIRAFARCELSCTKTDKADAARIARYCQAHSPRMWEPPSEEQAALGELVRRLEALKQMRQMERNRLLDGASGAVKESLEVVLGALTAEVEKTERLVREHVERHAELRRQAELLESIPGVGEATAAVLLAEPGPVRRFDSARQVAAYAGLAPRLHESGTSVRGRTTLSKQGRSRLRRALYFPAMTALRFNPALRQFAERLASRGKRRMAILGAAMRKLVHIAFGVLKSGKPFDPVRAAPVTAT